MDETEKQKILDMVRPLLDEDSYYTFSQQLDLLDHVEGVSKVLNETTELIDSASLLIGKKIGPKISNDPETIGAVTNISKVLMKLLVAIVTTPKVERIHAK